MKKDLSICTLNDFYGNLLTSKQSELIRLYYYDDLSLSEIAENEGVTRQAARDAIVKGVAALKGYEKNLKLCEIMDRLGAINDSMDKQSILEEIKKISDLWE